MVSWINIFHDKNVWNKKNIYCLGPFPLKIACHAYYWHTLAARGGCPETQIIKDEENDTEYTMPNKSTSFIHDR